VYIVWKIAQRRKFIRHFMMARILPEELKMKMDSGEEVLILDVRHALEFLSDPQMIPGALPFPLEQLNDQHGQIPRDREVIVYCN
jgi:rhodanese-related sulfurtransferase